MHAAPRNGPITRLFGATDGRVTPDKDTRHEQISEIGSDGRSASDRNCRLKCAGLCSRRRGEHHEFSRLSAAASGIEAAGITAGRAASLRPSRTQAATSPPALTGVRFQTTPATIVSAAQAVTQIGSILLICNETNCERLISNSAGGVNQRGYKRAPERHGTTNNGVCEHERIQPIQDHPSRNIRPGGVRAFSACRRTRAKARRQGSGSGIKINSRRDDSGVETGSRTSARAGGRPGRAAGCPSRAAGCAGCPRRLAGAQFRRTPLSRPCRLGGRTLASRGPRWA